MSSVKASGSGVGSGSNVARDGNATDTIRKLQDSYSEREVEENKKHREELMSVNETHKEEVQKMTDQHERSFRDMKARSEDALSKQDMAYQKEIKELKDMYGRRMEKLAQQNKKASESNSET